MNNYAMPIINWKEDEDGNLHVRRVLISYKGKPTKQTRGSVTILYFKDTRLIETDDYFKDETKSHRYTFEDDGYILISCTNENAEEYKNHPELFEKRQYHTPDDFLLEARFKAKNDEEAVKIFNERQELR